MTKTMARAFCAFNAFAFFAFATASGLVLAGILPADLTATGIGCVSILCGMVMVRATYDLRFVATRNAAPAETVEKVAQPAKRKRPAKVKAKGKPAAKAKAKPAPDFTKLPAKMSDPALADTVAKIEKAVARHRATMN